MPSARRSARKGRSYHRSGFREVNHAAQRKSMHPDPRMATMEHSTTATNAKISHTSGLTNLTTRRLIPRMQFQSADLQ